FTPISVGGPQILPPRNGSVRAFKFRDPDGHPLELLYFPPGQGRPIWHQQARDDTFLGIDHSAIGISDTSVSLAFYADILGMTQASQPPIAVPRRKPWTAPSMPSCGSPACARSHRTDQASSSSIIARRRPGDPRRLTPPPMTSSTSTSRYESMPWSKRCNLW